MNILTTIEVSERLSLDDTKASVEVALASALKSVGPRFEAVLESKLDETEVTDVFYVNTDIATAIAGLYRLRLSSGFVQEGTTSIYTAASLDEVLLDTATVVAVPSMFNDKNREKGFLQLSATDCADQFVRVEYTAGFSGEEDDTIPEWLKDAAFHYVVKMIALNQSSELKTELKNVLDMVSQHATEITDAHIRSLPLALYPVY